MHSHSAIPVVDLSAFASGHDAKHCQKAVQDFTETCRRLGFVTVVGHGVPPHLLDEAFSWSKKLFELSLEDKMKAPHPASNTPHRGYSPIGLEKVYSKAEREREDVKASNGTSLENIKDFKESYEIGSEDNAAQPNIWLPEDVLPGFRKFMAEFYWRLDAVARLIIDIISQGLNFTQSEKELVTRLHSGHNNQLRLLHYPPVPTEQLETRIVARMPPHSDWSSFTLLFQDDCGGLELQDPSAPGTFIPATPVPYSFILNIGDMFQRLTNGAFISPLHRVALPPLANNPTLYPSGDRITKARYSIPYFVAPDDDAQVFCLPSTVDEIHPAKYEPVVFSEYGDLISKYQYERGKEDEIQPGAVTL